MLKYFSSIGNMFSFSPHVKIFWVTGTMLQTQKIVFPTLHRACSRLALELGGSVDRGMRAAVWVEYDAEAEKPRTSFGVLAPIFPPSPPLLPSSSAPSTQLTVAGPRQLATHNTAPRGENICNFLGVNCVEINLFYGHNPPPQSRHRTAQTLIGQHTLTLYSLTTLVVCWGGGRGSARAGHLIIVIAS